MNVSIYEASSAYTKNRRQRLMSGLVDEKVRAYKMDWSLPNGFDK